MFSVLDCVNKHIADRLHLLIFQQVGVNLFAEQRKELPHNCLVQFEGLKHHLNNLWMMKMTGVYFCDLVNDFTPLCESRVFLDFENSCA